MPVIEVRGLTKRFGPVLAVDQLSFAVQRGTVAGFLGANGAGKTTTLRGLFSSIQPYLPYTAATTLGGTALGRAASGPANGASTTAVPLPFAAAAALLAGLAVLLSVVAARTTVRQDVS